VAAVNGWQTIEYHSKGEETGAYIYKLLGGGSHKTAVPGDLMVI
jgi:hypothetical protein